MNRLLFLGVIAVLISMTPTIAMPIISFFEEFPNQTTLDKIAQIDFDTRIYVAAGNLSDFYSFEENFKSKNTYVKDVIYWPVLEKEEGYWISPWSEKTALERIFEEIKKRKDKKELEVLLDLEFPLKRINLFNFQDFKENKKYVSDFIKEAKEHNLSVITAEKSWLPDWLLEPLGLSYNPKEYGNKKIKMYYSSFRRRFLPDFLINNLFEKRLKQFKEEGVIPAIGCIAAGIHGNEPLNSPEILEEELKAVRAENFSEVVIFRLGGLNKTYLGIIKTYVD